jgi:hypothetical protein
MAQVDFTPSPVFRTSAPKARMNAYFALLIIALFALILGCVFLYLEIDSQGGFGSVQGRVSAVEQFAPPAALSVLAPDVLAV